MSPRFVKQVLDLARDDRDPLTRVEAKRPGLITFTWKRGTQAFLQFGAYVPMVEWLKGLTWLKDRCDHIEIEP